MTECGKCNFKFDPTAAPGGLCPRCLLLGFHDSRMDLQPCPPDPADASHTSLEDDELAAELPGFELEEHLGRGGMGVVWKARERVLNRYVAIKLLRNPKNDPAFVERFQREARVMAQLNHANIITLFSFGRTRSNHCYLLMELVEGTDLGNLINRKLLDVPTALNIIQEVCVALRHAHDSGFVHRDIKPGNVLIDTRGRVKVADFGLARLAREDITASLTRHGWAVGTPHYIAPEQARGDGTEDQRADIYSVGVMLYQMLTGELPRGVFSPPSSKVKVDRRIDKIVMLALQEEPGKRYQSVSDLAADLKRVRETLDPGLIADRKAARHAGRWRQRLEMALAVAVSLVLGIVIADYFRDWLEGPSKSDSSSSTGRSPERGTGLGDTTALPGTRERVVAREFRLLPPTLEVGSRFGESVSFSGGWLAIGAPGDSNRSVAGSGAVYLYRREPEGWILKQRLTSPRGESGIRFGYNVSLSGTKLLVASEDGSRPGTSSLPDLYALSAGETEWRRVADPGDRVMPQASQAGRSHGHSMQLEKEFIIVGAPQSGAAMNGEPGTGAVSIFEFAEPPQ